MRSPPIKPKKGTTRPRGEYLTKAEVDLVRAGAASRGRHPIRDSTAVLIAYRHGLRASELVGLNWNQVDWTQKALHVRRSKRGTPGMHPLRRDEVAALRSLVVDGEMTGPVFRSERGGPLTAGAWDHIVRRAGVAAGLSFPIHSHMLRHACGYVLAMAGTDTRAIQAWLGHVNIQHTVGYTNLTMHRFADFFAEEDAESALPRSPPIG